MEYSRYIVTACTPYGVHKEGDDRGTDNLQVTRQDEFVFPIALRMFMPSGKFLQSSHLLVFQTV